MTITEAGRALTVRAESYASDARKFRDARITGQPIISADVDAHWAAVYQTIADELRKIGEGVTSMHVCKCPACC